MTKIFLLLQGAKWPRSNTKAVSRRIKGKFSTSGYLAEGPLLLHIYHNEEIRTSKGCYYIHVTEKGYFVTISAINAP